MALLLDQFGTAEVERLPITELSYEPGGNFRMGTILLSITGPDNHPLPLSVVPDPNNRVILTLSGKSFPLGDLLPAAPESVAAFALRPDKRDAVSITVRHSLLSWPTPFEFNFMTGHAPSWKRHRYHQMVWTKQSGATLELLWRHEQYFYRNDGWMNGNMTHEGSTGLIRGAIKP
ncbi:MAG TPA: hypothetical protein VEX43_06550 [Chthoniobacterales bacterium]|nr:hypothetical protein [Chthoniobacterales bacterium]